MKLHYKQYSEAGEPLLILHGLYGNQANWSWHARQLAQQYAVYALDARNHGQSDWADSMLLSEMAADLAETMTDLGIDQATLLGHSMGGKAAMAFALLYPQRVQKLVVVDIAPVVYQREDDTVLQALLQLDLAALQNRSEADAQLATRIDSKGVRDFLLTNLQRSPEGRFGWRFNLPVLAQYFGEVTGWSLQEKVWDGPVLFIRGEVSDYILPEHQAQIQKQFPAAQVHTIAGAGHWVHAEKPEEVLQLVQGFLQDS